MAAETAINREAVLHALSGVREPALNLDLVSANLIRSIELDGNRLRLELTQISPASPYLTELKDGIHSALDSLGARDAEIRFILEVPPDGRERNLATAPIRNAIAVGSGKGGVGKSTISVNLAVALAQEGAEVGLLDADVYGPNLPTMLGVERMPAPQGGRMIPASAFGVKLMSIAFLVKPGQPLIWRGPMLHSAIRQFISDVEWGELDYLIIDLPPGTGDAPLSLTQTLPLSGAVIVTLPQKVSLEDARRGLEMFRQMDVPIFGVIENMSFLELPDGTRLDVFGEGGGEEMAGEAAVEFLGAVPMDPEVRVACDAGVPVVVSHPDSKAAEAIHAIAADLGVKISVAALQQEAPIPIQILD